MKCYVSAAVLALVALTPLASQSPAGWKMHVDGNPMASDPDALGPIKFITMGTGFHATNPQAAVYWNPANTASGIYQLKGTFTLMKPSDHINYYGLIFGGSGLEGTHQKYLYFMVAQNGTWLIKSRDGADTSMLSQNAPSDAVKVPDATGKSTNALEVRVGADKIEYVVNGTVVASNPKTGSTANTNGTYGIRINHLLEVHIDGFGVSK